MIYGKKIYLRSMELNDCDILCEIENKDQTWLYSNNRTPYSKDAMLQFIKRSIKYDIYSERQLRLIIVEQKTNEFAGYIDLIDFDPFNKRSEIGIYIEKNKRKQNYASEALELIINYSFKILTLRQLYANIISENIASIKLFENKGFIKCAAKKDWIRIEDKWKEQLTFQLINE